MPRQLISIIKYKLKLINKTEMKEGFYVFFRMIPDIDYDIDMFWNKNENKICRWYMEKKMVDDVIISASPEILLTEICKRLGIKYLIASKVEKITGKYYGENCYGKEKVVRFQKRFPNENIDEFYSDSYSDEPLARIAKKSYLVSKTSKKIWYIN